MAKTMNVVEQAIDMMERIEKTRQLAIKELLALRSKIEGQLEKLGFSGVVAAAPVVEAAPRVRLRRRRNVAAPRREKKAQRVISAATRVKMLKAQRERRKREKLAKQAGLAAQKKARKAAKAKPVKAAKPARAAKLVKPVPESAAAAQE